MVEFRKIMKFGKSSFIISIPKKWIKQNNLKKGDTINVNLIDNNLVLSPRDINYKPEIKEITFVFDHNVPFNEALKKLNRRIITAYVYNYDTVTILFKKCLEPKQIMTIRDLFHRLMAMEVIEQTNRKIVAKDFLDIDQINISKLLNKINFIIKTMLSDYDFSKKNKQIIKELTQRDYDINRLSFVITRAVLNKLNKPGNNPIELFREMILALHLEKIGDEVKRMIRIYYSGNFTPAEKKIIIDLFNEVKELYDESIKIYFKLDLDGVDVLLQKRSHIFNKIDSNFQKGKNKHWGMVIEKTRRVAELIFDIGKTIYNTVPLEK